MVLLTCKHTFFIQWGNSQLKDCDGLNRRTLEEKFELSRRYLNSTDPCTGVMNMTFCNDVKEEALKTKDIET